MSRRKVFLGGMLLVSALALSAWLLNSPPPAGSSPLVCAQLAREVRYAKECSPTELHRVRQAYTRIAINVRPALSPEAMAGIASFLVDGGRLKGTVFLRRLNRGDIDACDDLLAWVKTHREIDPRKVKRRAYERAMCLAKGQP